VPKKNSRSNILSLRQTSESIKDGDLTPTELIEICIDKIKNLNPIVDAFISVIDEKEIIKKALVAEKEIKSGKYRGPLHGIPFSVKDIF
jgi:aspartyl-tRNA(Asn)/glutamyl-tRNA(Gln) amidotransferase subunit A